MSERGFIVALVILWSPGLICAELPVIKMPEYVISGVEQATSLTGLKQNPAGNSEPSIPPSHTDTRPDMPLSALSPQFERPVLHSGLGEPHSELEVRAGGFGQGSGRASAIAEGRTTAFQALFRINQPPVRSLVGPRTTWNLQADVIRWIGRDVTLKVGGGYEESRFVRRHVNPPATPIGQSERKSLRQSDIRLGIGSTPALLWGGRTFGQLLLNYTFLDKDRNLTASADRIMVVDDREFASGRLQTELGLDAETVSVDRGGHSLVILGPRYEQTLGKFRFAVGGRTWWGRAVATPASGQRATAEARGGGGITLALGWHTPIGGLLEIEQDSKPRFISFSSIHREWYMLDSTARGVTTEPLFDLKAAYSVKAGEWLKLMFHGESFKARHYPFPFLRPDESYSIRTGRVTINSAQFELEMEPTVRFGINCRGTIRDPRLEPGGVIPFMPSQEFGADASYRWGRFALSGDLAWWGRSHSARSGAADVPERVNLNSTLHWRPKSGVIARLGVNNLLDRREWRFPGYDQPPMTVWAGIEWHGTWTPW